MNPRAAMAASLAIDPTTYLELLGTAAVAALVAVLLVLLGLLRRTSRHLLVAIAAAHAQPQGSWPPSPEQQQVCGSSTHGGADLNADINLEAEVETGIVTHLQRAGDRLGLPRLTWTVATYARAAIATQITGRYGDTSGDPDPASAWTAVAAWRAALGIAAAPVEAGGSITATGRIAGFDLTVWAVLDDSFYPGWSPPPGATSTPASA